MTLEVVLIDISSIN